MQRNLATKIRAKRESGLTAVRLKRDPPVFILSNNNWISQIMLKPDRFSCSQKIWLKWDPLVISLIIQRNMATKIRAKRESSLTAVRLKRDPPVSV